MTIEELSQYVEWDIDGNIVLTGKGEPDVLKLSPNIAMSILREASQLKQLYVGFRYVESLLDNYEWGDEDFGRTIENDPDIESFRNACNNPFVLYYGILESIQSVSINYQDYLVRQEIRLRARESRRTIPNVLRMQVKERDKDMCRYCGKHVGKEFDIDHVIPHSWGGLTIFDNLVLSCPQCNAHKKDKSPEKAGMVLRPI